VHVVVGPRRPVSGNPGGVGLGVEGARGGIRLVGVDGHSGVALASEVGAPGLVGLVPVATLSGVIPGGGEDARQLCASWQDKAVAVRCISPNTTIQRHALPKDCSCPLPEQHLRRMERSRSRPLRRYAEGYGKAALILAEDNLPASRCHIPPTCPVETLVHAAPSREVKSARHGPHTPRRFLRPAAVPRRHFHKASHRRPLPPPSFQTYVSSPESLLAVPCCFTPFKTCGGPSAYME
jgi:hypothetical protein